MVAIRPGPVRRPAMVAGPAGKSGRPGARRRGRLRLKLALLDYLACPLCASRLDCQIEEQDHGLPWLEVTGGRLVCLGCGHAFPIRAGVPRLYLPERLSDAVHHTTEGFGWEWCTFNAQIDETYMTAGEHFLDFIWPITPDFFAGKVVLDAGCGMGRFLRLGAEWQSRAIIGVDLSRAVDAAYRNTRHLANAHVVQADIMALPFASSFDYIYSVGVLHHLEHPQRGFSNLVRHLRKAGRISVWVYGAENNAAVAHLLGPVRQHVTSRLPRRALLGISHGLGAALYGLIHLVYRPLNRGPAGRRLGRLLPYNDYFIYSSRLSYRSLVSVVFDHLVPQLAAYVSKTELRVWFDQEQLTDVAISARNNMSWRGHGARA